MSKKGIDVSVWQGDIDFNAVKASGIEFVIIRAGYGIGHKDNWFEENYRKAKTAGLDVGAYWYSYASSAGEAALEAQSCVNILSGKSFEYPVYFDLEEKSQLNRGRDFCDSLITSFCNNLEACGYYAGFYTSLSVANNLVSSHVRDRYALWIAQWNTHCSYQGSYGLWQYSSSGSVDGIAGRVDMDYAYVDYPSVIKNAGLNGYKNGGSYTAPQTSSIDEVAREVINGDWGNGNERKNRLISAGYDYASVQNKVNELLGVKAYRKSVDELAREVIRGTWGNGSMRKHRLTQAGYDYDAVQKRVNELL